MVTFPARLDEPPSTVCGLAAAAARIGELGSVPRASGRPEDLRRDNLCRAGWAAAVVAFAARCAGPDEPVDEVVSELLGDVMHLSDALGLTYADLEARGRRHYLSELGGQQ